VVRRYVLEMSILARPNRGQTPMSASEPEATTDYSNTSRASEAREAQDSRGVSVVGSLLSALALAGVALCVAATFSPVITIRVITQDVASYTAYDRHSVALLVIAAFALAMALGAFRGARPAMAALAVCGIAVLLIALLGDAPHLKDAGVWPQADAFEDAQARAGAGYYLETLAGVLLLASGAALLLLTPRRRT
jgi:hypothetical protein